MDCIAPRHTRTPDWETPPPSCQGNPLARCQKIADVEYFLTPPPHPRPPDHLGVTGFHAPFFTRPRGFERAGTLDVESASAKAAINASHVA